MPSIRDNLDTASRFPRIVLSHRSSRRVPLLLEGEGAGEMSKPQLMVHTHEDYPMVGVQFLPPRMAIKSEENFRHCVPHHRLVGHGHPSFLTCEVRGHFSGVQVHALDLPGQVEGQLQPQEQGDQFNYAADVGALQFASTVGNPADFAELKFEVNWLNGHAQIPLTFHLSRQNVAIESPFHCVT